MSFLATIWFWYRACRYILLKRLGRRDDHEHRLGVLAIMKNEAMNIREWVDHYLAQGAGEIYLIDNGSTDHFRDLIREEIDAGTVKVIVLNERHKQRKHYWTAFRHFQIHKRCQWLLVADLDEFWFCKDGETLADAVLRHEAFDVIYANWSIFGSSGLVDHPHSLRRCLTMRHPFVADTVNTKYIVRTQAVFSRRSLGIHKVKGVRASRTITDNTTFQINHYVTQSVEYFTRIKMTRGDATKLASDSIRDMAYFESYDRPCTVEDVRLKALCEHSSR